MGHSGVASRGSGHNPSHVPHELWPWQASSSLCPLRSSGFLELHSSAPQPGKRSKTFLPKPVLPSGLAGMTHSLRGRRNRAFRTVEAAVCLQRVFDKHTYPTSFLFYCQRMEGSPGSKSLPRHIPSLPISPPDEPGKSRAHVLPIRAWLLGLSQLFMQKPGQVG